MEGLPSNSRVERSSLLLLRVLTSVFLLISLILISITTKTVAGSKLKFTDFHSFRYMLAVIVIGLLYSLIQTSLSIFSIVSGDDLFKGKIGNMFNFYADKIVSYLLATGAAAGLAVSEDIHDVFDALLNQNLHDFFAKANASASLLLIASICSAISSIYFSSYKLPT